MVTRGPEVIEGWDKLVKMVKRYKLPVISK